MCQREDQLVILTLCLPFCEILYFCLNVCDVSALYVCSGRQCCTLTYRLAAVAQHLTEYKMLTGTFDIFYLVHSYSPGPRPPGGKAELS